jgi:hypothetical protein
MCVASLWAVPLHALFVFCEVHLCGEHVLAVSADLLVYGLSLWQACHMCMHIVDVMQAQHAVLRVHLIPHQRSGTQIRV